MNVEVEIIKDIPKQDIQRFEDTTIYNIARETLNMTAGFFPRLTGDLERGSYAMGVVGSNKSYGIGSTVDYAKYVWEYPQNTNWTNSATLAQWYYTKFIVYKEQIINHATKGARL